MKVWVTLPLGDKQLLQVSQDMHVKALRRQIGSMEACRYSKDWPDGPIVVHGNPAKLDSSRGPRYSF